MKVCKSLKGRSFGVAIPLTHVLRTINFFCKTISLKKVSKTKNCFNTTHLIY